MQLNSKKKPMYDFVSEHTKKLTFVHYSYFTKYQQVTK